MTPSAKLGDALERLEREHGKNIPVNLAYAEALAVMREAINDEREACAKVAESINPDGWPETVDWKSAIASAIRARPGGGQAQ